MLSVTCAKCGRRFTPTDTEIEGYLAANEGKKFALVLCPHCGKGNKVDVQRLHQALRFTTHGDTHGEKQDEAPAENPAGEPEPGNS